jgi:hypothetical protein
MHAPYDLYNFGLEQLSHSFPDFSKQFAPNNAIYLANSKTVIVEIVALWSSHRYN